MRKCTCFPLLFFYLIVSLPGRSQSGFDIQGHRGCRGLMPENTIPAFLKAVELGVRTIEMDVVISMDGQIVVSSEPWMSHVICSHPGGNPVLKKEEKKFNIYQMKYADIQTFDCGLRLHPGFPSQQGVKAVKPTLKMVVRSVQRFATYNKYQSPHFNIEIISTPAGYEAFTPLPPVFVDLVVKEIRRLGIEEISILQSMDVNILEELNNLSDRKFRIAYIVAKGKNLQKNLSKLTFKPDIYIPEYKLITQSSVSQIHDLGMSIIPWTVNNKSDAERLVRWGVDGIITDYPDMIKVGF